MGSKGLRSFRRGQTDPEPSVIQKSFLPLGTRPNITLLILEILGRGLGMWLGGRGLAKHA